MSAAIDGTAIDQVLRDAVDSGAVPHVAAIAAATSCRSSRRRPSGFTTTSKGRSTRLCDHLYLLTRLFALTAIGCNFLAVPEFLTAAAR